MIRISAPLPHSSVDFTSTSVFKLKQPAIFPIPNQFAIWMDPVYEEKPHFLSFDQPAIRIKPDAEVVRNDWLYL